MDFSTCIKAGLTTALILSGAYGNSVISTEDSNILNQSPGPCKQAYEKTIGYEGLMTDYQKKCLDLQPSGRTYETLKSCRREAEEINNLAVTIEQSTKECFEVFKNDYKNADIKAIALGQKISEKQYNDIMNS